MNKANGEKMVPLNSTKTRIVKLPDPYCAGPCVKSLNKLWGGRCLLCWRDMRS